MLLARAAENDDHRDFFTKVVWLKLRLLARAAENDDHRDFFTMVVRLNLKFPGHIQREMPLEILQISTGWERLRFTGVVEL